MDEPASLSPSLRAASPAAACELKFFLTEDRARDLEARLLGTLLPDPHSDPALNGMYTVASLSFDAPEFPTFYRDPRLDHCKFRVRRYGQPDTLYFERKRSKNGRVQKLRSQAAPADLAAIAAGEEPHPAHAWFASDVRRLDLAPVLITRCRRRALFGVCPEGAMRVTLDRDLRAVRAHAWSLDHHAQERTLLEGLVVCEFKFFDAMPSPLKRTVAGMALEPSRISKYRTAVRALAAELGLPPRTPHAHAPGAPHA